MRKLQQFFEFFKPKKIFHKDGGDGDCCSCSCGTSKDTAPSAENTKDQCPPKSAVKDCDDS